MSLIAGGLLGGGALAYSLYAGVQVASLRRARTSMVAPDSQTTQSLHDGTTATITGAVDVAEPAPLGAFLSGSDRPALVVWRLRRGKRSKIDASHGLDSDVKTVASGVAAGSFAVDDGHRAVDVDPEWLATRRGASDVRSLSASDLSGYGPWSKRAWNSPFADVHGHERTVWLDDLETVPTELRSATDDELDRYQLQARSVLPGDELTVHGEVDVRRGTPVLQGTDAVPMTISDRSPDRAAARLRNRTLKRGGLAVGLFVLGSVALGWTLVQVA